MAGLAMPTSPCLTWRAALDVPWGILILFGGGLSLAWCIRAASVDAFIGQAITALDWIPPLAFVASGRYGRTLL